MPVILSILSAFCYGAGDFSGSLAARRNHVIPVLVVSQLAGLICILIAIPFMGPSIPSVTDLLWGALAGFGGLFGLSLIYSGIAKHGAGIISPTGALVGTAIPVLAGIFFGEQPGVLGWAGIILALPAILLLTAEPGRVKEKNNEASAAFLKGFLSGVGFGVFFITIARTADSAGLWPLVGARAASITTAILVGIIRRVRFRIDPVRGWAVPLAGVLDMGANVLFMLAVRSGLLVLVSVITSLYPAPTVILSSVVFKEKLSGLRVAGILLAIGGVILMSV